MEASAAEVGGGGSVGSNAGLSGSALPPPFLSKTYDMVDDPATDAIVSWGTGDNSFVVWNMPEFARDLLPKYFKHNNFSSFVRQLNIYGFRKIDADRWEFASEGFSRGQKHLLKSINRKKPYHTQSQAQHAQPQNASGKFSLEEEIELLKRGKNVLVQELGRLSQQQQTTDLQLQTFGQRIQGMEQRQQQMMSFLAKAMQSPGFLAQLVQHNDGNRCIAIGNRKRRLPNQEDGSYGEIASSDRQIIKYQPQINEAAKAMLMQILKMDASLRLSNFDGLLLENFPSPPQAMDIQSTSRQNLGVSLAEVPPSTAICSSSAVPEIQYSNVADMITAVELPDIYTPSAVPEAIVPSQFGKGIPQFSQIEEGVPDGNEAESLYIESEEFSADTDIDLLYDEGEKLPGIVDPFWEQLLIMPPSSASTGSEEEVDSSMEEEELYSGVNGRSRAQNMDHLMEQMGLLTANING